MMGNAAKSEREALARLISRMIRAEARTEAPPEGERGDWLHGGADPTEFTKPDVNGWMAILPPVAPVWTPKALVFWHEVIRSGFPVSARLATHPRHSLARWPTIEQAVRAYMATSGLPATSPDPLA